ncbi:MAG TPA: phospholipase D-like domain-containing protein [Chloroflexota bacterium]|nr:phospholipase D-like domain-containing protein [Chloroflexota bacterium]
MRTWRAWLACAPLLLATGCGSQSAASPAPAPVAAPAVSRVASADSLGSGVDGVRLYSEPHKGTRWLTRPIRAAEHTLDLTMYLLTNKTIIHDLEYANAKGVRVRVILEHYPFGDSASGPGTNQSAYDQLDAAGISVHWASRRYTLTHEKSMVIDGATAYILTLNFTASAFTKNREFGIVDQNSTDVATTEAIFNADWVGKPYVNHDPNLLLSPVDSRMKLLALIGRARHTLDAYAEEVQDPGLETALVAAAKRGVTVRLISNAGDRSNTRGIARVQAGRVAVHLVTAPYIHAKLVLVDGKWAFVGSENISAASLDRNRELGVLVRDAGALSSLAATFESDWGS